MPGRRQFLRGRVLPDGRVATLGGPSSHLVAALAVADVLLDVPEDTTELPAGSTVEAWEL
jgi:molybdopterin molybdotransferase